MLTSRAVGCAAWALAYSTDRPRSDAIFGRACGLQGRAGRVHRHVGHGPHKGVSAGHGRPLTGRRPAVDYVLAFGAYSSPSSSRRTATERALTWGSREWWVCMRPGKPTATSALPAGKARDSMPLRPRELHRLLLRPRIRRWLATYGPPASCSSCRPAISSEGHLAEVMYEPGQVGRPWRPGSRGASRLRHQVKGRSAFFAQAGIPSPVPAGSAKRQRWATGTVP